MALTGIGKIFGVVTLGAASFINAGCSNEPIPVQKMIEADLNGDGILTRFEARRYIFTRYATQYARSDSYVPLYKLEKSGLERARAHGRDAMPFMPEHAKVFLAAVDELEKERIELFKKEFNIKTQK